jgi:hypothetical protein
MKGQASSRATTHMTAPATKVTQDSHRSLRLPGRRASFVVIDTLAAILSRVIGTNSAPHPRGTRLGQSAAFIAAATRALPRNVDAVAHDASRILRDSPAGE